MKWGALAQKIGIGSGGRSAPSYGGAGAATGGGDRPAVAGAGRGWSIDAGRTERVREGATRISDVSNRPEPQYRGVGNDEGRRTTMRGERGERAGWEVRLGGVQITVWLGLAVGSIIGSYFVGFFSGQSVGFESARTASAVEVAKLQVLAELPERGVPNVSAIYDRLNSPAVLEESGVTERGAPAGREAGLNPNRGNPLRAGAAGSEGSAAVPQDSPAVKVAKQLRSAEVAQSAAVAGLGGREVDALIDADRGAGELPTDGAAAREDLGLTDAGRADAARGDSTVRFLGSKGPGAIGDGASADGPLQPRGVGGRGAGSAAGATLGEIFEGRGAAAQVGAGASAPAAAPARALEAEKAELAAGKGGAAAQKSAVAKVEASESAAGGKVAGGRAEAVSAGPGERRLSEQTPAEKVAQRTERVPVAAVLPATTEDGPETTIDDAGVERSAAAAKDARTAMPSKAASTGMVKRVLPPGYFAQVAAPKSLGEAEQTARQLKASGFPVVIEVASKRGQDFYRVLVGPEQNRVHAERLVGQLKSERYLVGAPFIRQAE